MSVDYTVSTVLGVKVNPKDLLKTSTVKGCDHPIPKKAKFCPDCGGPATVEEIKLIVDDDNKINGLDVCYTTDEKETVVGIVLSHVRSEDNEIAGSPLPFFDPAYKTIRDILEPLNLWNEKNYALWTVMNCSY